MADYPQVTVQDVYSLLNAGCEDPVLWVKWGPDDEEDGPLELDVDPAAHVHHDRIVMTRPDAVDFLGSEDPQPEDIEPHLEQLQGNVDEVCDSLGPFDDEEED